MDLDNLQTFYGLFSQFRFHIPDYQRGYSWDEGQWKALMDDLSTLTEHNDHFTGLLVLHETKDQSLKIKIKGVVKEVYDIVDGQQRLTTLVILLDEIRRSMKEVGSDDLIEIADDIVPIYLYEPGPGNMLVPKLILDRNNHDFFAHNILEINQANILGIEIQSHKNLLNAQAYFHNCLAKKKTDLGEAYPAWLSRLYEKIANQMKVMVYKLSSEADAGVVFELMNNRGKQPNQLDLVKNYLLFLASKLDANLNHALTESINCTWETIFKQLTLAKRPEDEETLLQMHWLTVYDHDLKRWVKEGPNKSNVVKRRFSLLNYLDRYDALYQELENYVQTLRNTAVAYADLHMPEDRSDLSFPMFTSEPACRKEIIKYSQKLRRIGIMRPFIPLLIAIRLRFPEDAARYLETVKLCERYSFRVFTVAERRTNGKEPILFRLGNWIF